MIKIDEFRVMLRINKHDLDTELIRHAETQEHIGRELAWRERQLSEFKDIMESIEHDKVNAAKDSAVKVTVEQAKGEARKHPAWRAARGNYQGLQQDVAEWQQLIDAWRTRGFNLKTLADLYTSKYYERDSVSSRDEQRAAVRQASNALPRRRMS